MIFGNSSLLSPFSFHTISDFDGSIIHVSKQIKLLGITLDLTAPCRLIVMFLILCHRWTSLWKISEVFANIWANLLWRRWFTPSSHQSLMLAIHCLLVFPRRTCVNCRTLHWDVMCSQHCYPFKPLSALVKLHWLHVEKRIHFKYITVIFKCINNLAPAQLSSKIRLSCAFEMTLSTNLFLPTSSWGKKSFSYYMAPRCWNALPIELRLIPTLELFVT